MSRETDIPENIRQASLDCQGRTRGKVFLVTVLLFAALNACSYFLLTEYPWRRLTGDIKGILLEKSSLRIGFPSQFEFYPGTGIIEPTQWGGFAINIMAALVVALCYEFLWSRMIPTSANRQKLPDSEQTRLQFTWRMQFRLIHLFALTTITAVLLGMFANAPDRSIRGLKLIYIAGPCLITWGFWLLRRHPAVQSVVLLGTVLLAGIAAAIFASHAFDDFTFGLFGMFVCWLPQLLLIATVGIVIQNLHTSWSSLQS